MTVTYPASTVAIKHKSRKHKLDSFIPPAAIGLFFRPEIQLKRTGFLCCLSKSSSCSRSSHAPVVIATGSKTRVPAKHNARTAFGLYKIIFLTHNTQKVVRL